MNIGNFCLNKEKLPTKYSQTNLKVFLKNIITLKFPDTLRCYIIFKKRVHLIIISWYIILS